MPANNRYVNVGDWELTQAGKRTEYNASDRFNRKYTVTLEPLNVKGGIGLGGVVHIEPHFTDPLGTPQKYYSIPEGSPYTVEIAFQRWIDDLKQAEKDYHALVKHVAQQLYSTKGTQMLLEGGVEKMLEDNEIRHWAGPGPQDWHKVERAMKGDPEMLGTQKTKVQAQAPVTA